MCVIKDRECLISAHHVSPQVNTEDGDGSQRQGNVNDDEQQEGGNLWNVAGQGVGNGLLKVIKDQTTWRVNRQVTSCGTERAQTRELDQTLIKDHIF